MGLCRRGRKHSFLFVIEVAKGVDPKVQRIRRRVVLTDLSRFEHFGGPKYLSSLEPTPEGRHLYGAIDIKP